MKKLILKIFWITFCIPHIANANSDNLNQTNKTPPSPPANINAITGLTESTSFASPSLKPYTFQNSVYSKSFPAYKFAASSPILSPISQTYQTNFQPMAIQSGPTPVIMQYLPQSQSGGGVQYLQLIPTRPLIVPISPYITHPSTYPQTSNHPTGRSLMRSVANEPNTASTSSHPLYTPGSLIGGYASNIPNFQYFRPNKGMEIIPGPDNLNLNTNEYIPTPNDAPALNRITRARP